MGEDPVEDDRRQEDPDLTDHQTDEDSEEVTGHGTNVPHAYHLVRTWAQGRDQPYGGPMASAHRPRRRAGAIVLGVTAAAALATGVTAAALATGGSVVAAGAPVAPRAGRQVVVTTPLLSVRRLPDWIEASAEDRRLGAGVAGIVRRLGPAAATSCLVVSRAGTTVAALHPRAEVDPASNVKLLTATAALDRLGPASRFVTRVVARAAPVAGVVEGNLVLVGGGDPVLRLPSYQAAVGTREPVGTSLAALAAAVRAEGVRRVDGSVVGDESLFDAERGVAGWKPIYQAEGDVGPLSALDLDDGFSTRPPYGAVANPALATAGALERLLGADGVRVTGPATTGTAPAGATTVATIRSPRLGAVLGQILTVSDDTGAELLTKLIGRRAGGVGSTAAGVAAVRADLAADGLPVAQVHQVDGSGLDTADRASCGFLVDLLRRAGTTGTLFAGLPIAGRTGTLRARMVGTPAEGRLHAKTGTLDGVAALSGFVLPPGTPSKSGAPVVDQPIVFSFLVNGLPNADGVVVADALGAYLGARHDPPPLADALPGPVRVAS